MGKMSCKTCGANCHGEYCFQHKPRKSLPRARIKSSGKSQAEKEEQLAQREADYAFYQGIWDKRPHICEVCDKKLGSELLSIYFDHLNEKSKYPELRYEEENIALVCLSCHDSKTKGFPKERHEKLIEKARERFNV